MSPIDGTGFASADTGTMTTLSAPATGALLRGSSRSWRSGTVFARATSGDADRARS
jgi:hypothetical protein